MALIKIKDLNFTYPLTQFKALRGINLEVESGEFLLLCGPSGCGKTTLLHHLKHELWPQGKRDGIIEYDDIELSILEPLRKAAEIGLVMQNPDSQIVADVVWQELAFGLENLGVASSIMRRRIAEMASFFGIGSWFHNKTYELSGGQKQMLNLASILTMQPHVLLLDEPTAMLDPISSREFIEMISRVNRELGTTVIMAAHALDEVFHCASRIVLMDSGMIKHAASPNAHGSFLAQNPQYLSLMPACVRIYSATEKNKANGYPITISGGKEYLEKKLEGYINAPLPQAELTNNLKPAFLCKDIWYRYEKRSNDVLRGLSMSANKGELCCILGENGSGKSTLFSILAGLRKPDRGSVFIENKDIKNMNARSLYLKNIAVLPQNPKALFVCDSLLEELKTTGADIAEIEQVTKDISLENLLSRHPYDLSGGEQKKAALAKLLLTRPEILLLDEPTAGLDSNAKTQLANILHRLCDQGVCIVMITHDIEFAAENAARCLLLFDGSIACEDTARKFFSGNFFYTTAVSRMARGICKDAITYGDVIKLCENIQ